MSGENVPVSFGKSYTEGDGLGGYMVNSYGIRGDGEIAVAADGSVTLRGRKARPFWFGKDIEVAIEPARIQNVLLRGASLRFEIEGGNPWRKSQPGFVAIKAKTPESAAAVAAALPKNVTEKFRQQLIEQVEFERQLARVAPRSFVTPALVAINVLVFLAMAVATRGDSVFKPDGRVFIEWGSNFGPLTSDGQWWRLFSSTFLHFGLLHVLLNMYALYEGGRFTERLYGHVEFLSLYVGAGLSGSLASLLWNPQVNSAGASGAIFGVYGAMLAYAAKPGNRLPASTLQALWLSGIVFVGYSLFNGFAHTGIDNAAHVGGLAGGFGMGYLLGRPMDSNRSAATDWRRIGIAMLAAAVVLPLLASQVRNTGTGYRKVQQYQADVIWLEGEEARLNRQFLNLRGWAKQGGHSDAEVAERLDREVVQGWEAVRARLAANPLDPDARLYEHQVIVLDAVRLRTEAFRLLAEAIRTGNRSKVDASNAKSELANKALERLKQLNKPK